jgi:hypothetical protein
MHWRWLCFVDRALKRQRPLHASGAWAGGIVDDFGRNSFGISPSLQGEPLNIVDRA